MKRSILIIVNDSTDLALVQHLSTKEEIVSVLGVEAGIEQLYQLPFDGIIYEPTDDSREEKKLRKLLSLEPEAPVLLKKEPHSSWEECLTEIIKSIPLNIVLFDGIAKEEMYNICLN